MCNVHTVALLATPGHLEWTMPSPGLCPGTLFLNSVPAPTYYTALSLPNFGRTVLPLQQQSASVHFKWYLQISYPKTPHRTLLLPLHSQGLFRLTGYCMYCHSCQEAYGGFSWASKCMCVHLGMCESVIPQIPPFQLTAINNMSFNTIVISVLRKYS